LDAKYDVAQNAKARSQTKKNTASPLAAGWSNDRTWISWLWMDRTSF
jgi:hypothetical protein